MKCFKCGRTPNPDEKFIDLWGRIYCPTCPTLCDCGELRVPGDWPICKQGHGPKGSFGFDPFTPYVDPHLLPYSDPRARETEYNPRLKREVMGVRITSRAQRRQLMRETNTDWAGRPMGEPGCEV